MCDQMLARVGRWLRAAGYDTIIINESVDDIDILKQAIEEKRLLLTRDKSIKSLDLSKAEYVIHLKANNTQECVLELSEQLNINWLFKPFSRCLECNGDLIENQKPDLSQIPKSVYEQEKTFWTCSECGKVYWDGSHTKRMRKQLEQWSQS